MPNTLTYFSEVFSSHMTWITALFGATWGSFLNVCIFRIPEGEFFKNTRSVCRQCGQKIPAYLNLPIISWILLRGKTSCCQSKLSMQYPLVELFTAIMFVVIYWKFPFVEIHAEGLAYDYGEMIRFGHVLVFFCLLLVCSVIDLRHMIIPDVISLPMIALSPLVVWIHPELDWVSSALGILGGGLSLYAIAWIYYLARSEVGMGMGDVKLLAAIGGWLGYQSIIPTIFYGSVIGSLIGIVVILFSRKMSLKSAIPFGPFLAIGAIIHIVFGQMVQELLARG
jgi:leader peptidase (prepilin peptidase)/N-methyltransferase